MSEKVAKLGIQRDNDLMYYIKNGDVWAVPRKQKGRPKGKAQKVASTGLELDYSRYLYFLDGDGDVARKARALGGGRRAKAKTSPTPKAKKAPSSTLAAGTKTPSELDREIEECIAKVKKNGGAVAPSPSPSSRGRAKKARR
jgi:hypothetical protein